MPQDDRKNMPAKDLRVVDKGSFFDDPFFRDSWDDFDKAMKNVLDGHGTKTENQTRSQCHDMYRQLRSDRIDDDMYASQAIKLTEKDGKFQVVLDVKDFNPRDLQVKVVDERIILEGRYDMVSDDGKSSSSKAFYREFNLPTEADIDQVSTALSKDGILTINAPRKEGYPPIQQKPELNTSQASQFIQNALNDHRYGNGSYAKTANNYESSENYDRLSKDLRDRLVYSDKDSGHSSASASPITSGYSNTPSCTSPAPSDLGSETSKASTSMDFDMGRKQSPYQKSDAPFNVGRTLSGSSQTSFDNMQKNFSPPPPQYQTNVSRMPPSPRPLAATGSGGTASISVKEEDGKRTLTSEKSSLVQQKDGYLESKEVAAEVTEKDSQAQRREATTRMMKHDEDPEGKYKKSEAADASDVSETCVKQMPDGSIMTVKKSSTSTSNFKQSFSSGHQMPSLFDQEFPSGMQDLESLMGRKGSSLRSQMSSDSIGSNMSAFSDMSNFSRMSDMSNFSNMSNRPFPSNQGFPSFPDLGQRTGFPNFPNMGSQLNQMHPSSSAESENFSTSNRTSFNSSTFDKRKF